MAEIGDNVILSWVGELSNLEQQIEDLQAAKREFYAAIRDGHGKPVAAGLKAAMRVHRMDSEKRLAADEVDEEAARILSVIEKGASRAPRATRVETPREFPPVTSEIDEPAAPIAEVQEAAAEEVPAATVEPFTPPAFLSGASSLRPLCRNPENCGGYGRVTCHLCLSAAQAAEAAT